MNEQEILALVRRVATGDMQLEEFEEAFLSSAWDDNSQLARQITGVLAESSGNGADDVAIERLRGLLASQNGTLVINTRVGPLSGFTTGITTVGASLSQVTDTRPPSSTSANAPTEVIAGSRS